MRELATRARVYPQPLASVQASKQTLRQHTAYFNYTRQPLSVTLAYPAVCLRRTAKHLKVKTKDVA